MASWRSLGLVGRQQRSISDRETPFVELRLEALKDLFSGQYIFELPYFQRSYAWRVENVAQLVGDLFGHIETRGDEADYFLGNVMLGRSEDAQKYALVDGHQRLMTFTIFFAVLRDLLTAKIEKKSLHGLIEANGFHLRPQNRLSLFCQQFVQEIGATEREPDEGYEELSDTERGIIANRDYLRERLAFDQMPQATLQRLANFLINHCKLTVHIAPSADEAWARLTKEENTRLSFVSSDRSKSSLLSIMEPSQREKSRIIWEKVEQLLGSDDLHILLEHLRNIKSRKVSYSKPLDEELAFLYQLNDSGLAFMQTVFEPMAQHLVRIRNGDFKGQHGGEIAASCQRMSWIDNNGWLSTAMVWLHAHSDTGIESKEFFLKLERLVWMMRLAQLGPEKRMPRLNAVMPEIERRQKVEDMASLRIEPQLLNAAVSGLRAGYFDRREYRFAVLRRIAMTDGDMLSEADVANVNVEHVLPRTYAAKNAWRRLFPNRKAVDAHAHRLGNLTLMDGAENNLAGNHDLEVKRPHYQASKFAMTRELAIFSDWTPQDIADRTEVLIGKLLKALDLERPA